MYMCMHMRTQANASLVPRAKVAKLVLKQAYPELAGADDRAEAESNAARKEQEAARTLPLPLPLAR